MIRWEAIPQTISSAGPLIVVAAVFALYLVGLFFVILQSLRRPKPGREAAEEKEVPSPELANETTPISHQVVLEAGSPELLPIPESSEVTKSETPSSASDSDLISELQKQLEAALKAAKNAEEARLKNLEKAESLEKQLREVMVEIDNMYEQNAKALEQANSRRLKAQQDVTEIEQKLRAFLQRLEKVYEFAGDEKFPLQWEDSKSNDDSLETYLAKIQSQEMELAKMKEVLKVARTQIVNLTRKSA